MNSNGTPWRRAEGGGRLSVAEALRGCDRWIAPLRSEPHDAGWSSSVARRAHNPKVAGSNPAPATKRRPWQIERSARAFCVVQARLLTDLLTGRVMASASVHQHRGPRARRRQRRSHTADPHLARQPGHLGSAPRGRSERAHPCHRRRHPALPHRLRRAPRRAHDLSVARQRAIAQPIGRTFSMQMPSSLPMKGPHGSHAT
jgi:hypothetical protein